jgi:glutamate-1-semialdehyde aminotransferase
MKAGLATLKLLEDGKLIERLNRLGDRTRERLQEIFEKGSVEAQVTGAGSLFNVHFAKEEARNAEDAAKANKKKLLDYNLWLITNGVFFLPAHNGALSDAHSEMDLHRLILKTEEFVERRNA